MPQGQGTAIKGIPFGGVFAWARRHFPKLHINGVICMAGWGWRVGWKGGLGINQATPQRNVYLPAFGSAFSHRGALKIFSGRKWMVILRLLLCLLTLVEKYISKCSDTAAMIIIAVLDRTGSHRCQAPCQTQCSGFIQWAFLLRTVKWIVFPKCHFGVLSVK